nr:transposase [Ligilactobacillus sp. Marseille-Q7487]
MGLSYKNNQKYFSNYFIPLKKAFLDYEQGIRLALTKQYSNAKLESLHTHSKTLKRLSYGFRSFFNMRLRIFLINNLINYK